MDEEGLENIRENNAIFSVRIIPIWKWLLSDA
jgi:hypothetical protein